MPAGGRFQTQPTYSPMATVFAAVAVGVLLGVRSGPYAPAASAWAGLAAATALGWSLIRRRRPRKAAWLLAMALCLLAASYASCRWRYQTRNNLAHYLGAAPAPVCLEATVVDAPTLPAADGRWTLDIAASRARSGDHWIRVSGRGRLTLLGNPNSDELVRRNETPLQPGDRVRMFGVARRPAAPSNPGQFDYRDHYRHRGIDYVLKVPSISHIEVLPRLRRFSARRWIYSARRRAIALLERHLSRDQLSIAAALIVGDRRGLTQSQRDRFIQTGVMHLLAISGLHVGLLIGLIWFAERMGCVSRATASTTATGVAVAFALFTNAQPPVVRAALFVAAVCLARETMRQARPIGLLSTAGVAILLINPTFLLDTGVQLSFLAVATLLHYGDAFVVRPPSTPIAQLLERSRPFWLRIARRMFRSAASLFVTSLSLCVVLAPLTMRAFHVWAPISIPLNLIVAPLAACILLCGIGSACLDSTLGLGGGLGYLCGLAITALEQTLQAASTFPLASFWTSGPPAWWTVGFYTVAAVITLSPNRPSARRTAFALATWCLVWIAHSLLDPQESHSRIRCTFFDVGHGACVLIQFPDGRNCLYDAGSLGRGAAAGRLLSQALWASSVRTIDTVIISHSDADHYNAIPVIADRLSIGEVITSRTFADDPKAKAILLGAEEQGVACRYAEDEWLPTSTEAGAHVRLFQPHSGAEGGDNARSLLLHVRFARRSILLTGDLEGVGMERLLAQPPVQTDVLLAPHHGSQHSQPAGIMAWAQPKVVVASCRRSARLSALQAACRARQARLRVTGRDGAVRISIDSQGDLVIEEWNRRPWAD